MGGLSSRQVLSGFGENKSQRNAEGIRAYTSFIIMLGDKALESHFISPLHSKFFMKGILKTNFTSFF